MKQNVKNPRFVKSIVKLFFVSALIITTTSSHAQKNVVQTKTDNNIVLQYLETKNDSSKIQLRFDNPQKDQYDIVLCDVYDNLYYHQTVFYTETNNNAVFNKTFVIPTQMSDIKIIVTNRKTKVRNTFIARNQQSLYMDVAIK